MADSTHVQPGEKIIPKITADWFNSTLAVPERGKHPARHSRLQPVEGEMRCPYIGKKDIKRFQPAGVVQITSPTNDEERIPKISDPIDEYNWVVLQEDALVTPSPQGFCVSLTVITGLTRAWVTKLDDDHKFVTYDVDTQKLVTSDAGKAVLLKHETDSPSLITIETFSSSGMEVIFRIEEVEYGDYYKYAQYDYYGDANCKDREYDAPQKILAKVKAWPCGMTRVPGEDDDGNILVVDRLNKYFFEREAEALKGKIGIATYFTKFTDDDDYGQYGYGYIDPGCEWVVTDMDWHRWVQSVKKVRMTETELCFDIQRIKVWDDCDEDPFCIPLNECPDEYDYYGGSS